MLTSPGFQHDSHFQPMVPNDYYAYEFKLPRLTLESTKRYRLATRERRRFVRDGPWHHWRGPRQSIPTPLSRPFFEPEHLRRVAGYGPYEPKVRLTAGCRQHRAREGKSSRSSTVPSSRPASQCARSCHQRGPRRRHRGRCNPRSRRHRRHQPKQRARGPCST